MAANESDTCKVVVSPWDNNYRPAFPIAISATAADVDGSVDLTARAMVDGDSAIVASAASTAAFSAIDCSSDPGHRGGAI